MRRLKVLLLTSKQFLKPGTSLIGESSTFPFGDNELEDYVELLSASNIPFEIKYHDELLFEDIISNSMTKYSTIIMAVPEKSLSTENIDTINRASYDFGVSIIASYDRVGPKTKTLFGITRVKGKRYRFPCTVVIDKKMMPDRKIDTEIKLGDGWKIPLQKWGLRRHPIRYFKIHLKKFWEQVFSYEKIEISSGAEILALIKGRLDPAILKYQYGKAINYYIALQADSYLDRFNSIHRIVRGFIKENSGWGMVNINLEGAMGLRMDDPGSCERVYLKGYDTQILGKDDWNKISRLLKKNKAKLSVMYIPLWLDDANPENGSLFIIGKEIANRMKGTTYYSKDVTFIKRTENNNIIKYDYQTEFNAIMEGIRLGSLEIECHGLTHLDTNLEQWLKAKDRYSNLKWYHEFRHVIDNRDSTEKEQRKILKDSAKAIKKVFGFLPVAVTPSGHEQSQNSEHVAHDNGYKLFSSDYNSIRKDDLIIRNDKIKSIFFAGTEPSSFFFKSGYPLVGVFHDYEIVKRGTDWLDGVLKDWKKCGYSKFITLRELAAYLCVSIEAFENQNELCVDIDVSDTGDVSNNVEQRFFFDHKMVIEITLPKEKKPGPIKVAGNFLRDFEYDISNNLVVLALPPFMSADKQKITVSLI